MPWLFVALNATGTDSDIAARVVRTQELLPLPALFLGRDKRTRFDERQDMGNFVGGNGIERLCLKWEHRLSV